MEITIDIPDARLGHIIRSAAIRYWALTLVWDRAPARFLVVEREDGDARATEHVVTPARLSAGLALMAGKCPNRFAELANNRDEGSTGDVLVQLAVFGELKYG